MITIDAERCKACELCVSVCPKQILKIDRTAKMNAKGFHAVCCTEPASCISCAMCAMLCPDCVIRVEKEEKA